MCGGAVCLQAAAERDGSPHATGSPLSRHADPPLFLHTLRLFTNPSTKPTQLADLREILPHLTTSAARSLLASVGGDVSAAVTAAAQPAEVVRPPPPPPTTPLAPLLAPAVAAHPSRPPPPAGRCIVPGPGRKPALGRVKRCGSKAVSLLSLGHLHPAPGWHNGGYIFPRGYAAVTKFRSSVDLDATVDHECRVIGEGGAHWPAPTFVVVAADRPDEPLAARSATGAWAAVLARIGEAIEVARAGGANLPPPPRTQVAGPEYYGLTHPNVAPLIEALDPDHMCTAYWAGKGQRAAYVAQHGDARTPRGPGGDRAGGPPRPAPTADVAARAAAAAAGMASGVMGDGDGGGGASTSAAPLASTSPLPASPAKPPTPPGSVDTNTAVRKRVRTERDRERDRERHARERAARWAGGERVGSAAAPPPQRGRRRHRRHDADDSDADLMTGVPSRWSALERGERSRRRAERAAGGDGGAATDADAPTTTDASADAPPPLLPGAIDPITLAPVVDPAVCPHGHVMGLATWRAVLAETGACPFTREPLSRDRVTKLTAANVDRWRERLVVTLS